MAKSRLTASIRILSESAIASVQVETDHLSQTHYNGEVAISDIIEWLKLEVSAGDYTLTCIGIAIGHPGFGLQETEQQFRDSFNVPIKAAEDKWPDGKFSDAEATEYLLKLLKETNGSGEEAVRQAYTLFRALMLK